MPGTTPQGVETQRQRQEQGEEERRGEILLLIRAPTTPEAREAQLASHFSPSKTRPSQASFFWGLNPIKLLAMVEMFYVCTVQDESHLSHVATEHLKWLVQQRD